jgi:hypothetical protein
MTEQRFWSKVNKTESCWLWTANCFTNGYGRYNKSNMTIGAHRYSYILAKGEISEGFVVRHTCDVRNCVNPNHLLIGTHQDNTNDRMERGRHNCIGAGPPNGEKNGLAKLTEDDVIEIRIFREFGFTYKELGDMYGVSNVTIGHIIHKKTWSHI